MFTTIPYFYVGSFGSFAFCLPPRLISLHVTLTRQESVSARWARPIDPALEKGTKVTHLDFMSTREMASLLFFNKETRHTGKVKIFCCFEAQIFLCCLYGRCMKDIYMYRYFYEYLSLRVIHFHTFFSNVLVLLVFKGMPKKIYLHVYQFFINYYL